MYSIIQSKTLYKRVWLSLVKNYKRGGGAGSKIGGNNQEPVVIH